MRKDMFKVIVERPRGGGNLARKVRTRDAIDEDSPSFGPLRPRSLRSKWLNENLSPLKRFLHGKIGSPWAAVRRELDASLDYRNTVKRHVREHLSDFVAETVHDLGGEYFHSVPPYGRLEKLSHPYARELYVDPYSGRLCLNKDAALLRREQRRQSRDARCRVDPNVVMASARLQYRRIEGVWYQIVVAPLPQEASWPYTFDTLRNRTLDDCPRLRLKAAKGVLCNIDLLGDPDVYAASKRQLSSRELKRLKLK